MAPVNQALGLSLVVGAGLSLGKDGVVEMGGSGFFPKNESAGFLVVSRIKKVPSKNDTQMSVVPIRPLAKGVT